MGSHFHDWADYNGVAFSQGFKMGGISDKKIRKLQLFLHFLMTVKRIEKVDA